MFFQGKGYHTVYDIILWFLKLAHVRIEECSYIIQLKFLVTRCLLGIYYVQDRRPLITQNDISMLSILWNMAKIQFIIKYYFRCCKY